ncbi:Spx/MgsR family RNA polymerase-binding regulatory protein [Carnimonas bestiolae]|uniref:Spx/MgsR family RNA polymerase-binding regulatory protein n=1 Tax=Carnimonas bestiolae TaxID=3402172 RepID=UPI003EDC370F
MTATLYGLNTCDTCRKARRFLDSLGVDYTFVDLRAEATDSDGKLDKTLADWFFDHASWDTLINRRSTTWRQLDQQQRDSLDADSARSLAISHPTLLKRPLLVAGKQLLVGFDQHAYEQFAQR